MHSKELDYIGKQIKAIDFLHPILEAFTSPYIEEQLKKPLVFYIESTKTFIDMLIESYEAGQESVLGNKELAALDQLRERLWNIRYLDKEKEFSKKQEWLDFVVFVTAVNKLLADALKNFAEKTIQYVRDFMLEKMHPHDNI